MKCCIFNAWWVFFLNEKHDQLWTHANIKGSSAKTDNSIFTLIHFPLRVAQTGVSLLIWRKGFYLFLQMRSSLMWTLCMSQTRISLPSHIMWRDGSWVTSYESGQGRTAQALLRQLKSWENDIRNSILDKWDTVIMTSNMHTVMVKHLYYLGSVIIWVYSYYCIQNHEVLL